MNTSTSLLLLRHMDTTRDGPDPPLSEIGEQELQQLLPVLQKFPVSYVYSSDLQRTIEPAHVIAKKLGVPHQILPALREIETGQNGAAKVEDETAFEARVGKAIDQILADHNGSQVLVISHSGTIRAVIRRLLGLPLRVFEIPSIAPGSLIMLTRDKSGNWRSQS